MSISPTAFPPPRPERIDPTRVTLPPVAGALARVVAREGGRALIVGGFVRDWMFGRSHGDIDLEIFGIDAERLEAIAGEVAPARSVGRHFGILKVGRLDVSLPRADRRPGREGYLSGDPSMSLRDAARRRDFTLNAMAWDPLTGDVYDPFDGLDDLRAGRLRHVDPATFVEDPIRALRAIQFIARFPLELDPETYELCQKLAAVLPSMPHERIFEELKKLFLQGTRVGHGLDAARRAGIVAVLWPELEALAGCPQDPQWHPEGDVWVHTLMALDAGAARRTGDAWEDLAVMLGVLCHDLGKPATTELSPDGRIRSHSHDVRGGPLAEALLSRLTTEHRLIELVVALVVHHLKPAMLYKQQASDAAIRRLATRVNIELLTRVACADHLGRTTPDALAGEFPAGDWLLARARALEISHARPRPIVQGRHLIALGVPPGVRMGQLLDQLYDAQLEGLFSDLAGGLAVAGQLVGAPEGEQGTTGGGRVDSTSEGNGTAEDGDG